MKASLLALVLSLPLAGCISSNGSNADPSYALDGDPSPIAAPPPSADGIPTAVFREEPITPRLSTVLFASSACKSGSDACFIETFTTDVPVWANASLTWTHAANDLDLYLIQDGTRLASSEAAGPGVTESFAVVVPPGSYDIVVAVHASRPDELRLEAGFEPAPEPAARDDSDAKARRSGTVEDASAPATSSDVKTCSSGKTGGFLSSLLGRSC